MQIGVMLLNFGEPEHPTLEEVTPFLERIFQANAPLEGSEPQASPGAHSPHNPHNRASRPSIRPPPPQRQRTSMNCWQP